MQPTTDRTDPDCAHRHGDAGVRMDRVCDTVSPRLLRALISMGRALRHPWALAIARVHPVQRWECADREPHLNIGGYRWYDEDQHYTLDEDGQRAELPNLVLKAIAARSKFVSFDTPDQARVALARALGDAVRAAVSEAALRAAVSGSAPCSVRLSQKRAMKRRIRAQPQPKSRSAPPASGSKPA